MMSDDDFSTHVLLPSMDFAQVSCWLALRPAMTTATRSRSGFWWRAHEPGRLPHLASTSAAGLVGPRVAGLSSAVDLGSCGRQVEWSKEMCFAF